MSRNRFLKWIAKPVVFLLCLTPLALLTWNLFTGNLGFNPLEDITHTTGRWTLRFLLITLTVRPLRQLTGINELIRFRRMVGLFAFFYGLTHFTIFVWMDHRLDMAAILADISERPFITVGFTSFVTMVPLAITSTKRWIGRLGGKRWQLLHRLVYVSTVAGVVHYLWVGKVIELGPVTYVTILTLLLGFRLVMYLRSRPVMHPRGRKVDRVESVS